MTLNASRLILSAGDSSVSTEPASSRPPLSVYVLATSIQGTRSALLAASAYAQGLDTRVVLLVPHVVPYAQALDHPADSIAFAASRFRPLAETLGMDVEIRVCLCRPHNASLAPLIPQEAAVVIGGRTRPWWPTREQRLAGALTRSRLHVLFVPVTRRTRI